MQRSMAAAATVSAMLLTLVLPAAADRLDEVKARGKVIVGVSDTTPPFTFKRPGESGHVGYDIDLVRAVAKRLGVGVETVSLSSAERIPMLQQGKLDLVATSMTRTLERLREVDFSVIYFVTPHAVIVRKASGITSVHQLAGRKAASASTSTGPRGLASEATKAAIAGVEASTAWARRGMAWSKRSARR
jgi:polar amino acid transport system substrate-binding protein